MDTLATPAVYITVTKPTVGGPDVSFGTPGLLGWIETATVDDLDALPFGLVSMRPDGIVTHYNKAEARLAGLTPERVVGRNFFTAVAPCTNNFMVAHRFEAEPELDAVVEYVFTFRLAPMKVRLRLLKRAASAAMYLAVEPRG